MALRRVADFDTQSLANITWAFSSAQQLTPAIFDPISVLDGQEG